MAESLNGALRARPTARTNSEDVKFGSRLNEIRGFRGSESNEQKEL
jgi:hypothetical protein